MEGIKRMRYTPQEKINSLVIKIEHHLSEIKVILSKVFVPESEVVPKKKFKIKKVLQVPKTTRSSKK